MTEIDIAWLAGLLEGEGSFQWRKRLTEGPNYYGDSRISLHMTDKDIVERAAILMNAASVYEVNRKIPKKNSKPIYGSYVYKSLTFTY